MKVQAVAALNGRTIEIAPNFEMGKTNKSAEFLSDFPLGKVPVFKSKNGLKLFESGAIAQFVAESGPASGQLLGTTAEERALIRQWIDFADNELFEPITPLILWRYGMAPYNDGQEKASLKRLNISLDVLEAHLSSRQYMVTNKLSLADLSVAAGLYWGFAQVIDKEMSSKYPLTSEWYLRVVENDLVKPAFGEHKPLEVRRSHP
ncbi:Elongation factor 1-gamma [Penicillium rolfsii]|nr:Elongation factor 1-gamma [Penicillium rolfsii]